MDEGLTKRSIDSVKWNFISNVVYNGIYFVQTIILARLLPVEAFGIYAGAASIVVMVQSLATFGFGAAFVHRCKETEDMEKTSAVFFTLQMVFNLVWTALMLIGGFLFISSGDGTLTAFAVLILTYTVTNIASASKSMFIRQVKFQRFAIMTILDAVLTFTSAVLLALLDQPVWALLATNISSAVLSVVVFMLWKPAWKPRFLWDASVIRYFLRFGSQAFVGGWLLDILNKGSDFWMKNWLGTESLGFYSRAYAIAKIPGNVITPPINQVAGAAFAELKEDRKGLSEAFFEASSLLVRLGFIVVGLLALVAPEFIRIVLGEKWMPMLLAFRLLLPFAMFEPLNQIMVSLFAAIGKPGITVRIRLIQLAILVALLFLLGLPYGIEGVAVAVDFMMAAGFGLLLVLAREHIDLHFGKMFLAPVTGLFVGVPAGLIIDSLVSSPNDWISAAVKIAIFMLVYAVISWLLERKHIIHLWLVMQKYFFKSRKN
jgi:O-antigen/teichoic acid export membrane protein